MASVSFNQIDRFELFDMVPHTQTANGDALPFRAVVRIARRTGTRRGSPERVVEGLRSDVSDSSALNTYLRRHI